ncbi:hypothetical protein [Streptomyces broussonetiae]|uniref:hypothetical protein n=1 Tax=Streptomyces broussonetiae TaxID=2686304 RepID=UPI001E2E2D2E|nr:hypothetical protein [Streptomyces broussonetiae]
MRRPFRRPGGESGEVSRISSGAGEPTAPQNDPDNAARAQAPATALGVRAALDGGFGALLEE